MHEKTHLVIANRGLKTGFQALRECGMQPEFAASLQLMQQVTGTSLILRAGSPPVYDRPRSPKSGLNLSKTSNQGFFKGSLAEDARFTRVQKDINGEKKAIGHHKKDSERLKQHEQTTVPLPIRLKDIIRELGPNGDLQARMCRAPDGVTEMRFTYREGKGDKDFKGEFVIRLNEGSTFQTTETRDWDRLERDPNYDPKQKIIKKPENIQLSDTNWKKLYQFAQQQEFPLHYTNEKNSNHLATANVFANKEGLIVTGDWDGLALGHPPDLPENARKVFNTFSDDPAEKLGLIKQTRILLDQFKTNIEHKLFNNEPISAFETILQNIKFSDLYSEFALQRAGCITPFEFLTNAVANYAYKESEAHYIRDNNKLRAMDTAYEAGMKHAEQLISEGIPRQQALRQASITARDIVIAETVRAANEQSEHRVTEEDVRTSHSFRKTHAKLFEHIDKNIEANLAADPSQAKPLPHPDYDTNIQDLFQHGYDMRNPYGANLEGAWLLISNDGMIVHGKTQEELIEVMLSGDLLEQNRIDINFAADMSAGWHKVVSKQIALGQTVPEKTREALLSYQQSQQAEARVSKEARADDVPQKAEEHAAKPVLFGYASQVQKPAAAPVAEVTMREDQDVRASPRK